MIRVSKTTDYAIVILVCLGKQQDVVRTSEIAANTSISLPTAAKVLKKLSSCGLLLSQRGMYGGYELSRAPELITIVDIIEAFEGPLALMECNISTNNCAIAPKCKMNEHWAKINQIVYNALANFTVADLLQNSQKISKAQVL